MTTAQQPDIHWRYLGCIICILSWMPPDNAFPVNDWCFCQYCSETVCFCQQFTLWFSVTGAETSASYLMLEMSCRCSSVVSISGRTEANHSTLFSAAYCFSTAKSFSFISGSSPKICSTWWKQNKSTRWFRQDGFTQCQTDAITTLHLQKKIVLIWVILL